MHVTVDLKGFEVVMMMERSVALSQTASRVSAVTKFCAGAGEDPFSKAKDSITDLINKSQMEASSEASHVPYRDDELANASDKEADLGNQVATDSSKLEAAVSTSRVSDGEVSEL